MVSFTEVTNQKIHYKRKLGVSNVPLTCMLSTEPLRLHSAWDNIRCADIEASIATGNEPTIETPEAVAPSRTQTLIGPRWLLNLNGRE